MATIGTAKDILSQIIVDLQNTGNGLEAYSNIDLKVKLDEYVKKLIKVEGILRDY